MKKFVLVAIVILLLAKPVMSNEKLSINPYSVTLSVQDIDVVEQWYKSVLDFETFSSKEYPEFGTRLVFLQNGQTRIELIEDANAKPGIERPDPPAHTAYLGLSQFAFEVADIDNALERVISRAKIIWELQRYPDLGVAFFFLRDPEGNLIQFIQRINS